jgi:glycine cleavage system transcriptional repressor
MILLTILAMGDKAKNPLFLIANLCTVHQCNILNCYMSTLSGQQCCIVLVAANWSDLAKLETGLSGLQAEQGLTIVTNRPANIPAAEGFLPYMAQIIGVDAPGTVGSIMQFFASQQIGIEALRSETVSMNNTPMTTITVAINIPINLSIADLRDQFLILCDEMNIDGNLEPERR